eukprot:TRINITY_DN1559_c1_g1_i1.p1 TRINITY_DN1559_c1_g1~~TRINITY_DN1559_c1_g1_i1.p1  ORF type:complete len:234 (+),score=32.38 TRINITY_DN1559_c1_g1_i1:331-1032(+)
MSSVKFSYTLSNNATISMTWSVFDGVCILSFGGASMSTSKNTIKFSVQVENYKEYSNETTSVQVGSRFFSTESVIPKYTTAFYVINSSVPNYVFDRDYFNLTDMQVVATFPHFVETDNPQYDWSPNVTYIDIVNIPVIANWSILGLNSTWSVPKFPSKLNFDPDFQILLSVESDQHTPVGTYTNTSPSKSKTAMIVGVSVCVVAFVAVAVVALFIILKKRQGFADSEGVNSSD